MRTIDRGLRALTESHAIGEAEMKLRDFSLVETDSDFRKQLRSRAEILRAADSGRIELHASFEFSHVLYISIYIRIVSQYQIPLLHSSRISFLDEVMRCPPRLSKSIL